MYTLEAKHPAMAADGAQLNDGPRPFDDEEAERQGEKPKHAFVFVFMQTEWIKYPMRLRVNRVLKISVNGGPFR